MFYAEYSRNSGPFQSLNELLNAMENEKDIKYYLPGVVRFNLWYRDFARRLSIDAVERILINECPRLESHREALKRVRESLEREPIARDVDLFYYPKDGVLEGEHYLLSLKSMAEAVEVSGSFRGSYFSRRKEFTPLGAGIHVAEVDQRYPCFDEHDYAYENRYFENYFTSKKPFSDEDMKMLQEMRGASNVRLLTEATPTSLLPAIYYGGDGDLMIVGLPVLPDE